MKYWRVKWSFFIRNKWVQAKKGEKLTVPIGVTHAFRNPSGKVVKVYNTHEPALKMEHYFEDVSKVLDKVTQNRTREFAMNLKTMLYMGVLMNNYRDDIIAVKPPDAAVKILGFIAKTLGYKY